MKKKWCAALGIEIIYKTAVVCSDHFKSESYRKLTSRPLLKPDAVPYVIPTAICKMNNDANILNDPALEINGTNSIDIGGSISTTANSQEPETNSYNLDHYVMTNKDIMDEIQMEYNIDDRIIIPHCEGDSVLNDQIGSCNKRKIDLDEDCSKSKKKLRCQISNFGIIRREDFTCSKTWQRFVQFMAYSKSTMLKLVRKNENAELSR